MEVHPEMTISYTISLNVALASNLADDGAHPAPVPHEPCTPTPRLWAPVRLDYVERVGLRVSGRGRSAGAVHL